ncbi:PREDICTED: uncharacterized protein LOC101291077 [Fragaria vesca subsp. vesca]|uniref:uncharacterized protein LOC101291077 n=1 Tax=Fragaria vesca subsp. vesca TaxID=101020 RepID=UPI0002C2F312|nr:PREDICTED: uncharacterized protein LOC101291077 [Fragaria vesca subsp. vesca]
MDRGIEFDVLDAHGIEYHRWVSDIEQTFIAKDLTETIFPDPDQEQPSKGTKSQALMFLRKHIDPTLRRQYQSKHDPKDLWDALAERFGNIHSTLLPELIARWDEIRLLDYKKVDDFNRDMLCLQAQLSSCGVEKSDADMIEKTFSTFPSAAKILMNQYRLEFTHKRITTFSGLMTQLLMEEKNNMINDQHNLRPVGTRKIPESNYNCNRNKKAPKRKDQHRNEPYARGNQHHRASSSRGQGSGFSGRTNSWRPDTGAAGPKGGAAPPRKQHARSSSAFDGQCNRFGSKDHWSKSCRAPANVVAAYKKYKELMEVNSTENNEVEHNVTFKVADPNGQCSDLDAPDFDVTG